MAQFDESKHPRDNDGKFTSKDGVKEYRQDTSYAEILNDLKAQSNNSSLTKQEWALWYKAVAENKKLGYWAEETASGLAVLKVENEGMHKLVITGGTFKNPFVKEVYSFLDGDIMDDAITELKELW